MRERIVSGRWGMTMPPSPLHHRPFPNHCVIWRKGAKFSCLKGQRRTRNLSHGFNNIFFCGMPRLGY